MLVVLTGGKALRYLSRGLWARKDVSQTYEYDEWRAVCHPDATLVG